MKWVEFLQGALFNDPILCQQNRLFFVRNISFQEFRKSWLYSFAFEKIPSK